MISRHLAQLREAGIVTDRGRVSGFFIACILNCHPRALRVTAIGVERRGLDGVSRTDRQAEPGLAARLQTHGDAVGDDVAQQLIHRVFIRRIQGEITVLDIPLKQFVAKCTSVRSGFPASAYQRVKP